MRILAISYLFPNSKEPNYGIFVLNRLKAVSKYCDIKVINPIPWFPFSTLLPRYKNYDQVPKKEIIQGLEVYHPRFLSFPRILKVIEPVTLFLSLFFLCKRINGRYPFDILDIHWLYPDLPAGFMLARIFRKKIVVTLRGREALFSTGLWKFNRILVPLLNRVNYIISLSSELQELCRNAGVNHERFAIIRNGVDTKTFHFSNMLQARKQLDLNSTEKIILSVGALIYRKGFDRIIRCLPALSTKYPEIKLYIVGDAGKEGNYLRNLQSIIQECQVDDKIVFVGSVPNAHLVTWYNAADLFCLASRGEGSPNVLSEALTSGCPAVSTDVGSASDILDKDELGEIVPNDDHTLCPRLLIALEKKYDRPSIAAYMSRFDWNWCANQVIKVYEVVVRQQV